MNEGIEKYGKVIIDLETRSIELEDFEINSIDYKRILYLILMDALLLLNNTKNEIRKEVFKKEELDG